MSMIEDIKKDREFGTQGPWVKVSMSSEISDASGTYIGRSASGNTNARRIARVPGLEAALIAAEEVADAIDAYESAETAAGDTGLEDDYHFVFECWDVVQAKKAAYRAATGAA